MINYKTILVHQRAPKTDQLGSSSNDAKQHPFHVGNVQRSKLQIHIVVLSYHNALNDFGIDFVYPVSYLCR